LLASQDEAVEHPCRASIVASVTRAKSGEGFDVAIRVMPDEKWRVYWHSPRDGGMATEVRWRVPKGFTVRPTRYPVPTRFVDEGNIVSFGYDAEVWLISTIVPPADFTGRAKIGAEVDWLVCKETCYPGEAKLELDVPIGAASKPSKLAPEFTEWAKLVPVQPTVHKVRVRQSWRAGEGEGHWQVRLKFQRDPVPGSARYFLFDPVQGKIRETPIHHHDGEYIFELAVEIGGPEFDLVDLGFVLAYEESSETNTSNRDGGKPAVRPKKQSRAIVVRYEATKN